MEATEVTVDYLTELRRDMAASLVTLGGLDRLFARRLGVVYDPQHDHRPDLIRGWNIAQWERRIFRFLLLVLAEQ